jgi:hypothetical protein
MHEWSAQLSAPRHKSWRSILGGIGLVGGLVVLVLLTLGTWFRNHYVGQGEQRLQAALAEIEKTDPRWRWADILADRAAVPPEQNAAPHVLAVAQLLENEPAWPLRGSPPSAPPFVGPLEAGQDPPGPLPASLPPSLIEDALTDRPPAERLDDDLVNALRKGINKLRPVLEAARPVADRSTGRYEIDWHEDVISTLLPHIERARNVVRLLQLDAVLAAEEGDIEHASVSCRAAFHVARSLGDEPTAVSFLARVAWSSNVTKTLERALAQGTCSPQTLLAWQGLLADEEAQPLLRRALRGERAMVSQVLERVARGEQPGSLLNGSGRGQPNVFDWLSDWSIYQPLARLNEAVYAELMTRAIEATGRSPAEQRQIVRDLDNEVRALKAESPQFGLVCLLMPNGTRLVETAQRHQAGLRCVQAALAAERYRLARGRWPESLDQLVPEYLSAPPTDPFGEGLLHLRTTEDGLVCALVGPDGRENALAVDSHGRAIRFRLYDLARRHQLPRQRGAQDPLRP